MIKDWRLLGKSSEYKDNVIEVIHKDYRYEKAGCSMPFTVLNMSSWATIVPVTKDGSFLIVKQFRAGNDMETLEFPGGGINNDEKPLNAAIRELREETGASASTIHLLNVMDPNPAFMSNRCHVFLAEGCVIDAPLKLDTFEDVEVLTVSKEELLKLISSGDFRQSISLAAFALYLTVPR